jgi:hypothetical protein
LPRIVGRKGERGIAAILIEHLGEILNATLNVLLEVRGVYPEV